MGAMRGVGALLLAGTLGWGCAALTLKEAQDPNAAEQPAATPNDTVPVVEPNAPIPDQLYSAHTQATIAYAAAWPKIPSAATGTWEPRDWKASSQSYHTLLFNESASGTSLPLVAFNPNNNAVAMPSYVNGGMDLNGGGEALTVLGGLVGASLGGMDMRSYRGRPWLNTVATYARALNGNQSLILSNNRGTGWGGTAWYALFPTIMAAQLADLYQSDPTQGLTPLLLGAATGWGSALPVLMNNWNHTGFNFFASPPAVVDAGWVEPDMAIGIAYISELAYQASNGNRTDLNANAGACLNSMDARGPNAHYEVLAYYGAALAARRNALRGEHHDVSHYINWTFSNTSAARAYWGIDDRRWGSYDAYGLCGEVRDGTTAGAEIGYGFAMNTFTAAAALAPLARYMPGYARALGRYLLHVAVNGQLFFPDAVPQANQTNYSFYQQTQATVCYESCRGTYGSEPISTGDSSSPLLHLAPYGSWSQGYLGALFTPTNEIMVLQIDLLATDFWHPPAHPTYLYYNPYAQAVNIQVPVPKGQTVDFIDLVTGKTLARGVHDAGTLAMAADQAVVLLMPPTAAAYSQNGNTTLLNGIAIDWGLN